VALLARAARANEVYRPVSAKYDTIFLSIHFDSTSPRLSGINFYYPYKGGTDFVDVLAQTIRQAGRARQDLDAGSEFQLCQGAGYAVLAHGENPDSYLVELGNLRCRDGADLHSMCSPTRREEYAALLLEALRRRRQAAEHSVRGPGRRWRMWPLLALPLGTLTVVGLAIVAARRWS
jgi:N-acetylmuramoyl-L-alanine amidase